MIKRQHEKGRARQRIGWSECIVASWVRAEDERRQRRQTGPAGVIDLCAKRAARDNGPGEERKRNGQMNSFRQCDDSDCVDQRPMLRKCLMDAKGQFLVLAHSKCWVDAW